MRVLALFLFMLISAVSSAQTPERAEYDIWSTDYAEVKEFYAYGNKVMVRSDSSSSAAIIDSILLGDKVTLLRKTSSFSTINNIYAPWIAVSYAGNKKGFVWLGVMAFQQLVKDDTVFLYGFDKVTSKKLQPAFNFVDTKFSIGLKASYQNKLLDKKEWTINGDESANYSQCKLLGNMGLQNTHEVLRINLGGEACGIPTNYFYHAWNGQRFYSLPTKYSVGDAGVYYHSETLLFPSEQGGKPGYIIRLIEEEEMLEEETATKPAKYKKKTGKEVYAWNGERAVKLK